MSRARLSIQFNNLKKKQKEHGRRKMLLVKSNGNYVN